MRQGPYRERELIRVARIAKQIDYKLAWAHIVRQVRKNLVSNRIVANVLDHAPAVGVRSRMLELSSSQSWITAEKQGNNRWLPGKIDQLLMGEKRISPRDARERQKQDQRQDSHARDTAEQDHPLIVAYAEGSIRGRFSSPSKGELQRSLKNARRGCTDDIAKGRTANVAVDGRRSAELRVLEKNKGIHPEEERFRLGERQVLRHSHVEIVCTRAVEKSPFRIAWRPQCIRAEHAGAEVVVLVLSRIVVEPKGAAVVVRLVNARIVDAVRIRSDERIVTVVDHRDREAAGKMTDAGK